MGGRLDGCKEFKWQTFSMDAMAGRAFAAAPRKSEARRSAGKRCVRSLRIELGIERAGRLPVS